MAITMKYIYDSLDIPNVESGVKAHLYRIHLDRFIHEDVVINYKYGKAFRSICFRIDKHGKPTTTRISESEGVVYSNGSNTNVWFLNPSERKASKALIDVYEGRIDRFSERVDKCRQIVATIKKGACDD